MAQRPKSFAFGTGAAHTQSHASLGRLFAEMSLTNLTLLTLLALVLLGWAGLFTVNELNSRQIKTTQEGINVLVEGDAFKANESKLLEFGETMRAIHRVYGKQAHLTNVFSFLESKTQAQVQWLSLDLGSNVDRRPSLSSALSLKVMAAFDESGRRTLGELMAQTATAEEPLVAELNSLVGAGWLRKVNESNFAIVAGTRALLLNGVAKGYQDLAEQLVAFTSETELVSKAIANQIGISQDGRISFSLTLEVKDKIFEKKAPIEPLSMSSIL